MNIVVHVYYLFVVRYRKLRNREKKTPLDFLVRIDADLQNNWKLLIIGNYAFVSTSPTQEVINEIESTSLGEAFDV